MHKGDELRSAILNSMHEAIVSVDEDQHIVLFNSAAERVFGYPSEEVMGQSLGMLMPEANRAKHRKLLADFSGKADSDRIMQPASEISCLRKNGDEFIADISISMVRWHGKRVYTAVLRDVMANRQAGQRLQERRRDRFRKAQYITQMGDFTWDVSSGNVTWSTGMRRLLKYDEHEPIDYAKVNRSIHHPDDVERVTRWLEDSLASGKEIFGPNEYRLLCKDGEVIWVETNGSIDYQNGKAVTVFGTCQNITARKQAEEAIVEQYRRNELILHAAMDGFILTDERGQIVDVNPAYCTMVGFERSELLGMNIAQMEAMFSPEQVGEKIAEMRKAGSARFESQHRHKDGRVIDLDTSIFVMQSEGQQALFAAFVRDIQESKAAKVALIRREKQLAVLAKAAKRINCKLSVEQIRRALVESACELVACESGAMALYKDGKMCFREYIKGGEAMPIELDFPSGYGVPGHVMDTRKPYTSSDARCDPYAIAEIQQLLDFIRLIDVPILDSDGKLLGCLEMHDRSDGKDFDDQDMEMLEALAAIVCDALENARLIADLTDLTTTLKHSEASYRDLVEVMPDGIVLVEGGEVVFANPEALRLYGYREKEATGQPVMERIHPDDRAKAMARVRKLLQKMQGFNPLLEERMLRLDGSEFVAETASAYVEFEGRPAVLIVLRDVSERVLARKMLQESTDRLQAVARNMTGVVFQFGVLPDGGWYFPYISESVERFVGVSAERVMADAQTLFERVHPEDLKSFMGAVQMAVEQRSAFAWQGRFVNLAGGILWLACSSEPQELEDDSMVWNGVAFDETPRHHIEEQFRQAQKMEAVGTLVGGIAHDFNNMLAGMLGQLYLVRHGLQKGVPDEASAGRIVERVRAVEKQGRLAAEVITQMMTFARKGQVVIKRLDLNRLVADAMRLHRVAIPENIIIQAHLGDTLMVEGDSGMIQQMLLNLLTNARDALQDQPQPHIDITLSRFVPDAEFRQMYAEFETIPYACLEVRDNGCGMSEQQMARIFDPFFTTKGVGKGTGLGLAMLYGAMQTHHGHVLVESGPGEGACFRLYFPLLASGGEAAEQPAEVLVHGKGQYILLADDESVLIEVIKQALEMVGYRVLTARDGEEAVRCFKDHSGEVALAVLDAVMPLKGGVQAAREMREIAPTLPIVFHTGYGQEAGIGEAYAWEGCVTVNKPVNIEHLSRIIADLLGEAGS